MKTNFYPEMNEKPSPEAQIIATLLHRVYKVEVLNGKYLETKKNVELQYKKENGNFVYYLSEKEFNKLEKKAIIAIETLLD